MVLVVLLAGAAWAAGPGLTTINDTVYRADGTAASGTALISWPAFQSADGSAVAAGSKSVAIGPAGAFSTSLAPNVGATPTGTYYTVVFQLDDGTVRTEYWSVPTTSPVTISGVRTTPGTGAANGLASKQYVDGAVATRALDAAVVHLTGAETITGTKQFAAAPTFPAPVGTNDAANKAYVDGAVANVGAGNFVAKAGDTMTGPLTLVGDPAAPNQAANRHYVDTGLAVKAGLVNGVVPPGQLGSGAPDGTKCLLGSSTWGPCGGSGDAVSIRGTSVANAAPTDGQVITYEASSNSYKPKAGSGAASVYQTTKYATDFQYALSPSTDLSTPGVKTVTLASCPAGMRGDETDYWVYIAGTGTPEAVKVTGGTCAGDGNAGTVQFTTVNPHAGGYTINSASAGIAEASIAARYKPLGTGWPAGGKIVAPYGDIAINGQLTIKSVGQTIEFPGGTQSCYSATTPCVFIGDKNNSNSVFDVTLVNFRGLPRVVQGTQPMVEVNAQKTRIVNLMGMYAAGGGTFGSWITVDDDEAFIADGIDVPSGLGTVRCDASYCGTYVKGNGNFNANPQIAPVGWIKNSNLSVQCGANPVDWASGNTLHISDSVVQGYPSFGIRYSTATGGYGGLQLDNVYFEYGAGCGAVGPGVIANASAGVIMQGGSSYTNPSLTVRGGEGPAGSMPSFVIGGSTTYRYFVVAIKADGTRTVPLYFGDARPTNGSVQIPVKWYDLPPAATYDVLRITDTGGVAPPWGTGTYAVATALPQASVCSGGVCSYTDAQAALSSYTVPAFWTNSTSYWAPKLNLWPGAVVLSPTANTDFNTANHPVEYTDLYSSSQVYVTPVGGAFPQIFASHCAHGSGFGGYVWPVCLGSYYPQIQHRAMAGLTAGGDPSLQNLKGVLNLGYNTAANGPTHLITLFDRYPDKTAAYGAGRAPNDAGDTFLGIDSVNSNSNVGLSLGSNYSISHYIGNNGDGTNWKERLTSALKEIKVPAQFDSTVTIQGLSAGCLNISAGGVIGSTGQPCGGGGGGGNVTSVFGRTGAVVASNGDYAVAQITGAAADASVIHISGTETIGGAKTFSSAVVVNTGSASLFEGTKQPGNSVTLDGGYDYGFYLRSDNTLGCQLSAGLGGGSCLSGGGGGAVTSVFGRTGAVVATSGDYSVAQVTGAAADAAVVHNTGAETIAGAKTFSNDATFNGNLNVAGNINQTGTGPTQWSGVKWTGTTVTVPGGKDYSLGVGSDNLLKCQLASGSSCFPSGGGGGVTSFNGRTGAVVTTAGDYAASQITGLATVATSGSYNDLSNQPAIPSASSSTPAMDGTGAAGTAATYARGDHVHPTDTSRAALASPAFTGTPTAPTPSAGDNSTRIATTAYVQSRTLTGVPWLTAVRGGGSVNVDTTANKAKLWGVVLTFPITTAQVVYNVTTADNSANVYDLGIYDASGDLMVHTGPIAGSTLMNPTGAHAVNWAASNTLQPGKYYLAITTNCTASCAVTVGDGSLAAATFLNGVSVAISASGTLNGGVAIPADTYSWGSALPSWWIK